MESMLKSHWNWCTCLINRTWNRIFSRNANFVRNLCLVILANARLHEKKLFQNPVTIKIVRMLTNTPLYLFLLCLPSYGLKGIPSFLFCKLYVHKHMNKGNSPLVYCIWPEMGKQNIQALPNFQAFKVKVSLQTPHFIANTYLLP